MFFNKIKSYAKINLSLGVLGKHKSGLHKIESLIVFIDLYDEIYIKEIKNKIHKIKFYGEFSKNIPKLNTVSKLLKILDKKNLLKDKKFFIKIKKKIPQMSGMGGGSMNAANILNYLIKRKKIMIDTFSLTKICKEIGSDVIFGITKKMKILREDGKYSSLKKKPNLYIILLKPNFGCSTKSIYNSVSKYSKPNLRSNKHQNILNELKNLKNDLETPAFKKYPLLLKIKNYLIKSPNIQFARMTGSGSCIVGYFSTRKALLSAAKKIKKKYKNYWCILSKTI